MQARQRQSFVYRSQTRVRNLKKRCLRACKNVQRVESKNPDMRVFDGPRVLSVRDLTRKACFAKWSQSEGTGFARNYIMYCEILPLHMHIEHNDRPTNDNCLSPRPSGIFPIVHADAGMHFIRGDMSSKTDHRRLIAGSYSIRQVRASAARSRRLLLETSLAEPRSLKASRINRRTSMFSREMVIGSF